MRAARIFRLFGFKGFHRASARMGQTVEMREKFAFQPFTPSLLIFTRHVSLRVPCSKFAHHAVNLAFLAYFLQTKASTLHLVYLLNILRLHVFFY